MRKTMILLLLSFFMQCTSLHKEEQQILKQAAIIHNEMVEQAEIVEERLNEIAIDTSFLFYDSIHIWKRDLALWESELVEVPGNEEEHHHKQGNHYHDHQQLNVTAAQMMVIQLELQRRLYVIVKRIDRTDSLKK